MLLYTMLHFLYIKGYYVIQEYCLLFILVEKKSHMYNKKRLHGVL